MHYSDYEIGSYATGSPEIKIKLDKIRHLIAPKGPLGFLIKADEGTVSNSFPFYSVSPDVMPTLIPTKVSETAIEEHNEQ